MKIKSLLVAMSLMAGSAFAQTADPIIMTIGGKNIKRSEFEYAYNKNAAETTIDEKSIDEYVDLFVNYKLKVIAAEEAGIDTTAAFRKEFLMYRDQQIRPTFIVDDDIEREARNIYKQTQTRIDAEGGLVHPLHILVALSQQADAQQQRGRHQRLGGGCLRVEQRGGEKQYHRQQPWVIMQQIAGHGLDVADMRFNEGISQPGDA